MLQVLFAAGLLAVAMPGSHPALVEDPQNHAVTPAMRPLPARAVGRFETGPLPKPMPAGAVRYTHEWPGIYFEAAFRGATLALAFDDAANEYRLTLDDGPPIAIRQPGRVQFRVAGLSRGRHRIRLEKVTESVGHPGAFDGFYVTADEPAEPVPGPARQMEFIGDSSMTGYGVRSETTTCGPEEARRLGDAQQAYPALAAKRLGADYQLIAISGRGLVRNFRGIAPDEPMLQVYPRTLIGGPAAYDGAGWRPQVVVVRLLADFVGGLQPGERWTSMGQVAEAYVQGYGRLIENLHERYPDASVVIVWPDEDAIADPATVGFLQAMREAVTGAADRAGVRTAVFSMPDLPGELTACQSHLSLTGQQRVGEALVNFLEARPELWRR
jgi:hypothetical protein